MRSGSPSCSAKRQPLELDPRKSHHPILYQQIGTINDYRGNGVLTAKDRIMSSSPDLIDGESKFIIMLICDVSFPLINIIKTIFPSIIYILFSSLLLDWTSKSFLRPHILKLT